MGRWHSCNVLQPGSDLKRLWQFSTSGSKINLQREDQKLPNEKLPEKIIAKDWHTLFQPKLNIAWFPADKVFLRVVQMPKAEMTEMQSMIDLQLEKLSPLPVTQIVWGYELIDSKQEAGVVLPVGGEMQTVIVVIVARSHVEEFLGQLEGQGYFTDRLELPFLDELRATHVVGNGAWIYPGIGGNHSSALVAWWYYGTLQNLAIVHLPADEKRATIFQQQLYQMTWAGELEGWLTSPPTYYLVGEPGLTQEWRSYFPAEANVEIAAPVPSAQLAALTAQRVAQNSVHTNLLPPEYTTRYKQQFMDRLWMRALGALLMLYIIGAAAYLGWAQFMAWRLSRVTQQAAQLGVQYTNTVQIKEQVRVLQEQLDLQYAALDCWKAVADNLPTDLTLDSMKFDQGRKLTVWGTAPTEEARPAIYAFNETLMKSTTKGQPLFSRVEAPNIRLNPGSSVLTWSFVCELKRSDND